MSEVRPQAVADDALGVGLTDPIGMHRSHAACAIGNIGEVDTGFVRSFQTDLVAMLTDPKPLARQNAAYALGRLALDDAASVATAGAGEYIFPLLETDLVGTQENGIQLLALLAEYDPAVVGQPGVARDQLRTLQGDSALSVDAEIIRDLIDVLDTQASRDTAEPTPDQSRQTTDRTIQSTPTRTDSAGTPGDTTGRTGNNTNVFTSGSTGETATSESSSTR